MIVAPIPVEPVDGESEDLALVVVVEALVVLAVVVPAALVVVVAALDAVVP